VERRARLDESRKLWQFYWDMADEENWIKEKEQIVTNGDIGHDLTTINLLLSKHKVDPVSIAASGIFIRSRIRFHYTCFTSVCKAQCDCSWAD